MSNPFSGIITTAFKDLHENAISALVENTALTVPCRIVYTGTKFENCTACSDGVVVVGNQGNNPYYGGSTGGFNTTAQCSICNGSGKIPVETSENIYLLVIFNYKKFINFGENVPEGDVQTFCKKELTSKLKNAAWIIIDTDIEEYKQHKFTRVSEPTPIGLGRSPFIYTTWKKA